MVFVGWLVLIRFYVLDNSVSGPKYVVYLLVIILRIIRMIVE